MGCLGVQQPLQSRHQVFRIEMLIPRGCQVGNMSNCNFISGQILHTVLGGPVFTRRPCAGLNKGSCTLTQIGIYRVYTYPRKCSSEEEPGFGYASEQAIDEITRNFSKVIRGLQAHNKLQQACEVLQNLAAFIPRFSESAQVSVMDSLVYLNEQLLKNSSSLDSGMPVTVCLFHALSNAVKAAEASQRRSKHDIEQVENILKMSLLSLGSIQEAFLPQNRCSESAVTLTSSAATLMLSRQNISTLPRSSYTLGSPAPVRLGFPSVSALEELLNKHPGVNVQITLWRNESMETHPTNLNVSTDHFIIMVNVTSLEKSLIVHVAPESPLLMTLYLGFQYQPNHMSFHLNITLPKNKVSQKDEAYTWVLTPESLQFGVGTYYVTAVVNKSKAGAQRTPTLFWVVTAVTQCYYWDSHSDTWRSSGCQVGPQSTLLRTQCLCNHLSYFGSEFFIVPRTVNIEDTVELFLRVTRNPVGVSLLASLLGFYMFTFVWAWRKDQTDMQKVKVTVLADNDPSSLFHYLIEVSTGYRRRAATTAKVVITLYGSEGRSKPHHLCDSQKAVFERGGLDVFLLGTPSSLGELHSLRLWHDNSGVSPSWYINQVIVSDIAGKRKWHFLCNCWLAMDLGDCERDRVFSPISKKELFSFRHLFSSMIVEKFTQDYLWLSVATRHPWNQFTRVQRLTCCVTLLLCNMVINIMFWKINDTTAKRDVQVGPLAVTWSELLVSVQSAVILFPINVVIGQLFPLIQSQEPLPFFPPIQASCPSGASFEPLPLTEVAEVIFLTLFFSLMLNRMPWLRKEKGQQAKRILALLGFITDGNSFLLGNVLLRQIRIPGAIFLPTRVPPQEKVKSFHQDQEDTENYGVNWGPPDTNNTKSDSIWHYQNQETLGGYPIRGEFATYSGGGYTVRLGRNSTTAMRVLQQLEQSQWLDRYTKGLFVEFVVFNANVNLFCIVTLILESNNIGAFFTSVKLDILTSLQTSKDFAWSVISQVIYYLLVCYYVFIQGRQLKQQRWRFFTRKRNILDMSIILISFVILGLDMKFISLHKENMAQYHCDRDRFINFYEAVKVNSAVIHLMGFLVLLATVQLWNLLRQNLRLQVIGRTLSKAWDEVLGFLLVILILLSGYAIAFNLLFGWSISDYRTLFSSAVTVVGLLMGISHYKEVKTLILVSLQNSI
ncbi:polycystic kidney disease 1-like protein [Camelus ferus]|nr:polycystic kidney disease 1-like protein [Camelus ferus]